MVDMPRHVRYRKRIAAKDKLIRRQRHNDSDNKTQNTAEAEAVFARIVNRPLSDFTWRK